MTFKPYYECHITMEGPAATLRPLVEALPGWKFSAIDGDPVLGPGVKCYATTFYNERHGLEKVASWVQGTAAALRRAGANVIREKVEHVVWDTRARPEEACDGGCPGCHLDDLPQREV